MQLNVVGCANVLYTVTYYEAPKTGDDVENSIIECNHECKCRVGVEHQTRL